MKAIICTKYGSPDVLNLRDVAKPIPKGNEVLVRVHATTVTSGDCRVRSFESPILMWLMTYEEAASVSFGGTTALHYFRKGKIQNRQKVLIYGASGAVGTSAVQLAKLKSLGADKVMDYTKEDFTNRDELNDIIFDAVGKTSKSHCKMALTPSGTYVSVAQGVAAVRSEDLNFLRELVEAGGIIGDR